MRVIFISHSCSTIDPELIIQLLPTLLKELIITFGAIKLFP